MLFKRRFWKEIFEFVVSVSASTHYAGQNCLRAVIQIKKRTQPVRLRCGCEMRLATDFGSTSLFVAVQNDSAIALPCTEYC